MNRLSPTVVTVVASLPAIYFAYRGLTVFAIAFVLAFAQMAVGLVIRVRKKQSPLLDRVRSGAAISLLCVALYRNIESTVWRERIRFCLKGDVPSRLTDLKGYEDIWTDYVIKMEFKADPESIRKILESGKFRLQRKRVSIDRLTYVPVDAVENARHEMTTDSAYSFMLIEYSCE